MKILIQLGHPAQFHFLKNAISIWEHSRHTVRVLIKSKDVLETLLAKTEIDYVNFEPKTYNKNSRLDMLCMLVSRTTTFLKQILTFKPDIVISPDPILARICKLFKINFIAAFDDDYAVIKRLSDLLLPHTNHVLAPRICDFSLWQHKKIEYEGYMKLAYLHPNRFTPILEQIKQFINTAKPYIVIRLVVLNAHHDNGIKGINDEILDKLISKAESLNYEVYLSSEKKLSDKYSKYHLSIPAEKIHNVMAFASLLICDSQSMAVEAAMLGVPSVRFNDFAGRIGVLEELEHKYGLTYGIKTSQPDLLFAKIEELIDTPNLRDEFQRRRQKMLADKIDVTAFLVWFIENYPQSAEIMKKNPDYQFRFK